MTKTLYRIGQIVPSSNTTMETEIPAMLRAREAIEAERVGDGLDVDVVHEMAHDAQAAADVGEERARVGDVVAHRGVADAE